MKSDIFVIKPADATGRSLELVTAWGVTSLFTYAKSRVAGGAASADICHPSIRIFIQDPLELDEKTCCTILE